MTDKEKEERIKELSENFTFEEVVKMLVETEENQKIQEVKENNLHYAVGELQKQHQEDCITINQLNTTIDDLFQKELKVEIWLNYQQLKKLQKMPHIKQWKK